jgi:quinol monooxygenase YgiN
VIHVLAEIEVRPGVREAFLSEFHRIVPLVRDEDGCLEYGAAVDNAHGLEGQPPPRSNVVTVVEKWSSLDALRAHLSAEHMADYRKRAGDMIVGVRINVLDPA